MCLVVISVSLSVPVIDCWKSLVRGGDGYQIRRDWPPRRSRSWLVWWLKLSFLSVREELDRPGFSVVSTFHDNKPVWKVTDLSFYHYENVWEDSFIYKSTNSTNSAQMIMVAHCMGPQFLLHQTQNNLSIASHLFKVNSFANCRSNQ